uniref:Transmembrane protein 135 n=1 Tax=Ascaris suum TaxID=6253 RepID=F1L410_ASCSU
MSVLSKFFGDVLGFKIQTANCYELHHTWNPNCYGAIRDAMWDGCSFSFQTYATLYILAAILSKRDLRKINWLHTLRDTCRSTAFLTINLAGYLWFMCRIRQLLGFSILPTMGLVNGFLASWLAILVESPKRRPLLSLYLTNLASETAYRQLANHGYVRLLPNGQIVAFAIGLAGFMYLFRRRLLTQNLCNLLNLAIRLNDKDEEFINANLFRGRTSRMRGLLIYLRSVTGKHRLCTHTHSCVGRSVEGFTKNFTLGFGLSSLAIVLQNFGFIFRRPARIFRQIFSYRNLRLAMFLGCLPLFYHGSHCITNRLLDVDTTATQVFCVIFSSLAMLFYPNVSIAMYILWKFIEACYRLLVTEGYLPQIPYGDILLYTLSTGYVLWCVTIEPHAIRKGYWSFLNKLTGRKVEMLNRRLYDMYGFRSSLLFSDFVPQLNPKFTTINPATYLQRVAPSS